ISLSLVWSNSLSDKRFSATVPPVKSFGGVCRGIRTANGLSQKEVAEAGGLDQSRVSEIERGRYLPGLDMAMRLAKGLGVTLTEIVAQWEGTSGGLAFTCQQLSCHLFPSECGGISLQVRSDFP